MTLLHHFIDGRAVSAPNSRNWELQILLDGIINGRGEFSCEQSTMADFG